MAAVRNTLSLASSVSLIGACALLFFFALEGVTENPNDLNETGGIPAVTMYTVMLIVLTAASVAMTGLGCLLQNLLKRRAFKLRIGVYALTNILLFLTSLLGALVAAVYTYDTIAGILGGLLFAFSLVLVLIACPRKTE